MARRPDEGARSLNLSPRMMRIGGWIVALALIAGIAVVVGVLGGDADGAPAGASPSASGGPRQPIAFGTAIDAATGLVAAGSRTDRFTIEDTFAYSADLDGTVPDPVYVEVRRTSDPAEVVQAPVDGQRLRPSGEIGFEVPADDLFEVFGPGDYLMLIYAEPDAQPIAEGSFVLVGTEESPSLSPSASP